jgi:F-type H+-transporting ATPase subunit b
MLTVLAAEDPLIPNTTELVVGILCFFIVFGFLGKKLLPGIQKTLEERHDAIEGGLERATEAQAEAARLRQDATEQGATIIQQMREEGQRQREEIVAAGHTQIEADRKAAAVALRQDVGKLATDLAGKLVGESLEDSARQSRTIDRFLDQLEDSTRNSGARR